MSEGRIEELSPDERRLASLLALLRSAPEGADRNGAFIAATMRTVRWQRALRGVLRTIGSVAAALSEGVVAILSSGREPRS